MEGKGQARAGRVDVIGNGIMRRILSLCDYSGEWSKPYLEAGYDVECVDLQRDGRDIRLLQKEDNIHGILAAPPCTCFASSGAWVKRSDADMIEALSVVDACIRLVFACKPKWWALENPVGKLARYLGKPRMYFQPCDYGDPYTKRTCLWGEFTPPVPLYLGENRAVKPVLGNDPIMKLGGKSRRTKNARSKTPAGFARAFFEVNP